MNRKRIYFFSIKKKGHYKDWEKFFKKFCNCKIIVNIFNQIKKIFSFNKIIYIDGDYQHLYFSPLIILRAILGQENIVFSIRTEFLFFPGIKHKIKRIIFKIMRKIPNIKTISIHKNKDNKKFDNYINEYIYDIQYWDLNYFDIKYKKPKEMDEFKSRKKIMVILGIFDKRKASNELVDLIKSNIELPFTFIFAGKVSQDNKKIIEQHKDCFIINRYIKNEEMFYLYKIADIVYCYYSEDNRPSGIFGRAMQFKRYILVKKGGYLDRYHKEYKGLLPVNNLNELNQIKMDALDKKIQKVDFDDSKKLKKLVYY